MSPRHAHQRHVSLALPWCISAASLGPAAEQSWALERGKGRLRSAQGGEQCVEHLPATATRLCV